MVASKIKAKQMLGLPPPDTEFKFAESLAESTYSDAAHEWQNKLTLSTNVLESGGVYRVGVSYYWGYGWASGDFRAQVLLAGAEGFAHRQEPKDTGIDQRQRVSSFLFYTGTGAAIDIDLEFTNSTTDEARIGDARLEIWRVA